ncbi:hypothetical protein, partial [Pseudomonas sp. GD03696]|uniref:hypothetical protein n=1 Tax=Pseudomonas sp. GD03696 TaxID=2975368 RepID=UPI00244CDD61
PRRNKYWNQKSWNLFKFAWIFILLISDQYKKSTFKSCCSKDSKPPINKKEVNIGAAIVIEVNLGIVGVEFFLRLQDKGLIFK